MLPCIKAPAEWICIFQFCQFLINNKSAIQTCRAAYGLARTRTNLHACKPVRVFVTVYFIAPPATGSRCSPRIAWFFSSMRVASLKGLYIKQRRMRSCILRCAYSRSGQRQSIPGSLWQARVNVRLMKIRKLIVIDEISDEQMDKATMRWKQIEKFLETHPYIMNADVRKLCGVSAATANRILASLATEGKIVKYREGRHWAYRLALKMGT